MKIVGLTGGIGSGKSMVASVFERLDVPVYSADAAGRRILNDDLEVRQQVKSLLGTKAYSGNVADRAFIASMVFETPTKLESLNSIIHPAVKTDFEKWKSEQIEFGYHYCIRESAILFETKTHLDCDLVVVVIAPESARIKRVINRDGVKESDVRTRMEKQMKQDMAIAQADLVIDNSGDIAVIPQVMSIHRHCLK